MEQLQGFSGCVEFPNPGEGEYGGYRGIQNPKQRYTLIDRQKLETKNL